MAPSLRYPSKDVLLDLLFLSSAIYKDPDLIKAEIEKAGAASVPLTLVQLETTQLHCQAAVVQYGADLVVVYRGTNSLLSWALNLIAVLSVRMPEFDLLPAGVRAGVCPGWYDQFRSALVGVERAIEARFPTTTTMTTASAGDGRLFFTGHSLGGIHATMHAVLAQARRRLGDRLQLITFGAPAAGDERFARLLDDLLPEAAFRVVHQCDMIAMIGRDRVGSGPKAEGRAPQPLPSEVQHKADALERHLTRTAEKGVAGIRRHLHEVAAPRFTLETGEDLTADQQEKVGRLLETIEAQAGLLERIRPAIQAAEDVFNDLFRVEGGGGAAAPGQEPLADGDRYQRLMTKLMPTGDARIGDVKTDFDVPLLCGNPGDGVLAELIRKIRPANLASDAVTTVIRSLVKISSQHLVQGGVVLHFKDGGEVVVERPLVCPEIDSIVGLAVDHAPWEYLLTISNWNGDYSSMTEIKNG